MANLKVLDGDSGAKYVKTSGAGSDVDPHIPDHTDETLHALVGEVQASPTSNTLLDRLKALLTGISLAAGSNAIGKLAANSGVDIGDVDVLSIAAGDNNIGNVDIASALPAGTNAIGKLAANSGVDIGDVDVTSVPAPLNLTGGGAEASALRVTLANDSTGVVSVDDGGGALTVDGTVTANLSATDNAVLDAIQAAVEGSIPAGTNAIGKLSANSGVDIGDVDVTSLPSSTNTLEVVGDVAHDGVAAGNPLLNGAKATNAEQTAVANADAVMLVADLYGKQIVMPYADRANWISGTTSAITDTTRTAVIAAQGAGVKIYVTSILVTNSHADTGTFVKIENDTTTIWQGYAAPVGGGFACTFPNPLVLSANAALNATCVTTGASVIVNASGWKGN